jgi:hypothetical protein
LVLGVKPRVNLQWHEKEHNKSKFGKGKEMLKENQLSVRIPFIIVPFYIL